ncbi:MAG: hypothetical protein JNN07_24025 [Verrucomicrobiales bacterium]|nr:hypothetical protein [Verrucomicrobiales bacterium]
MFSLSCARLRLSVPWHRVWRRVVRTVALGLTSSIALAEKSPLAPGSPAGPSTPVPTAALPGSGTKGTAEKDPLAYRVLELQGGTIAKFDNWVYTPIQSSGGIAFCDGFPQGRQNDFVLRAAVGTPSAADMANFFTQGPLLAQQVLAQFFGPVFRPAGEPKKTRCGGDEAMVESYEGSVNGRKLLCQVMYVKRKDVAIAVLGIGTDAGFKEFGRSIEIVAQSITFKESSLEAGLVGTWTAENFSSAGGGGAGAKINVAQSRSITFYPNGSFSDTAQSGFSGSDLTGLAQGGNRGTVVKRGTTLTFRYDNGNNWSAGYELFSNGLKLDGQVYVKQ